MVTISSCMLSYALAVPFYLLVERPFKNLIDLIIFPRSSIFKKHKDVDDDDDETEEDTVLDDNGEPGSPDIDIYAVDNTEEDNRILES